MTTGWLSAALDDLLRSIRGAAPYPGNAVDLVLYETERARRLALAGAAGAAAGLAGLRAADPDIDGQVRLAEPGTKDGAPEGVRRMAVPPGERVLTLGEWVMAWSAAILARDALSALTLCSAEILMPATEAQGQTGPVWAPHCGLLAAATLNRGSLPDWIDAARDALHAPRATPPEGAREETDGVVRRGGGLSPGWRSPRRWSHATPPPARRRSRRQSPRTWRRWRARRRRRTPRVPGRPRRRRCWP